VELCRHNEISVKCNIMWSWVPVCLVEKQYQG
jgi:hypothetical protein